MEPDCSAGTYTPDPGFGGTDSFRYEVCDPKPLCGSAKVSVLVNSAPKAQPVDMGTVAQNSSANPWTPEVSDQESGGPTCTDPVEGAAADGTAKEEPDCTA